MKSEFLPYKSNGFLDCVSVLEIKNTGNPTTRVIGKKVYDYNLAEWKNAYLRLCDEIDDCITYGAFLDWLDAHCLRTDLTEKDVTVDVVDVAKIVKKNQAAFENACDYLYYGYGYRQWYEACKDYISADDAKIVWKAAHDKMAEEDW